jgi:hypothetical protein
MKKKEQNSFAEEWKKNVTSAKSAGIAGYIPTVVVSASGEGKTKKMSREKSPPPAEVAGSEKQNLRAIRE